MGAVSAFTAVAAAVCFSLAGLFGLLLLAVLLLPVHCNGRVDAHWLPADATAPPGPGARWQLDLSWGWLLVRVRLAGEGLVVPLAEVTVAGWRLRDRSRHKRERPGAPDRARVGAPRRRSRRWNWPDLRIVQAGGQEALRLVRRLWRSARLQVRGQLTYGLGDPALMGLSQAVLAMLPPPPTLHLATDYLDPGLTGWVTLSGRLYGIEVVAAALAALRNPVLRRRLWRRLRARLLPKRRKRTGGRVQWT